jgi:hypothetical protein
MNNLKKLKKYANQFIERLKPSIRDGYTLSVVIHPANSKGAVLEFEITDKKSVVSLAPSTKKLNDTLQNIEQKFITGNIQSVTFGGTNVYMDGNRIILIKGDDEHESWNNSAVESDIERVLSPRGERN